MGAPSTQPSPAVGSARPTSSFTAVVFPAPFGPRKPNTSARRTLMVRPLKATVFPYRLARSWVWTASEAAPATSIGFRSARLVEGRCNGEHLVGSQLASDGVDYAFLLPDHARPEDGFNQQARYAIDLDRFGRRQTLRNRYRQRGRRILDRLDLRGDIGRHARLRQQVILELCGGGARRINGRDRGLRDHESRHLRLAGARRQAPYLNQRRAAVDHQRTAVDAGWHRV